jgi:hypothetical protein
MQVLDQIIKKSLKKADVLFCVCTHRNFNIDAAIQAMSLIANTKHKITFFPMKGDALIDRARSRAASYFMLEREDDILFFVDDDENFKSEDVIKVIDHVVRGMDICGGMVVLKKPQTVVQSYIDKNILFLNDQSVTFKQDAKPVEIRLLGSGFMAIHRKVFQKMIDEKVVPFCHPHDLKFWPFFMPMTYKNDFGDDVYLSEDWSFCHRARELGFRVWLDPSVFISHHGDYSWDLADALRPPKVKMGDQFSLTLR